MSDTIFTVELSIVRTREELKAVMEQYPDYDGYFIASSCIQERRDRFDRLWPDFQPFSDGSFLSGVRVCFHQRTWEMYMGNVLLEKGFEFVSDDEGPDFIVGDDVYVECVAPTRGDSSSSYSVPELIVAGSDVELGTQDVPTDQMILRITQAFKDKACDQYDRWRAKEWFDEDVSFVIAINSGDLDHFQDYLGIPIIIKALFGLEFLQIDAAGSRSYSWRIEIEKGAGVPVNYFTDDSFSFVSGVIFSSKRVLDHPSILGDDCIFVNNPFAKTPVNTDFISSFKNWEVVVDGSGLCLQKNY